MFRVDLFCTNEYLHNFLNINCRNNRNKNLNLCNDFNKKLKLFFLFCKRELIKHLAGLFRNFGFDGNSLFPVVIDPGYICPAQSALVNKSKPLRVLLYL